MKSKNEMLVRLCGKCGIINNANRKACEECGATLEEPTEKKKALKQCELIKEEKERMHTHHPYTPEEADRIKATATMWRGLPRRY